MFLCQYPAGERGLRVIFMHRYHGLQYDRATIDCCGNKMNAGTVLPATGLQCLPVRMQAGKFRQQ